MSFSIMVVMKNTPSFRKDILFHEWLVVGALTLVMAGFYGAELSFSVFLKPMVAEFGWTRAGASGSVSAVEGLCGLLGIVMGTLADRYGARILIAIGGAVGGLGLLFMSRVSSLWQLYLFFGVMMGLCLATCWTPITATVTRLFEGKRLLVLGITSSGITAGNMVLPPLMAHLIALYGWRFAYLALGSIVWVTAIPAVILLRKNPPDPLGATEHDQNRWGGKPSGEPAQPRDRLVLESAKTVPFWMLVITGFVTATAFYFVATHIVAYGTDVGIAPTSAALILTFSGAGNILGKLMVWPIAARIGNRSTLFLLLILQALALFLIVGTTGLGMFFALGSVFGLGFGGCSPVRTAMIPDFFGMRSVGTIIGLVGVAWGLGGVAGPFLAGYVFDLSRSYDVAFFSAGLLTIIGIVATYFLRAPKSPSALLSVPH